MDFGYDRSSGTSTAEWVDPSEIRTDSLNKVHGVHYQPSKVGPLRKALTALALPKDQTFIDLGCGKGRALLIAAELGFKRVVGVEYSPIFCETARANAALFLARNQLDTHIEVVEADAALFQIQPDHKVFFMFNPFDAEVMAAVLENIRESLDSYPREACLIYNTPVCHQTVVESRAFETWEREEYWGNQFIIYRRHAQDPEQTA